MPQGTPFYRWNADIDGDGKNEVFLSVKSEYTSDNNAGQIPSWDVYLADHNDTNFTPSAGTDFGDGHGVGPGLAQIDPNMMFIGQITQLGKRGIVTAHTDYPRNASAVAYVYAYTIENDHLKRTLLAQYDPAQGDNAIYNQYLQDGKRTQVTLQEITP